MADFNILVGVQSGDAIQKLANVEKGVARVGNATRKTNAQLKQHANQYNKTAVATNKWAKGALQQAGYQVGDFFVQIQGGTNALQAFGQQGSQLLGIFGPIGAVLGAGVAIFAAFGTVLQKTGKQVTSAQDGLEKLESSLNLYKKAAERAIMPTEQLLREFGKYASQVRENLVLLREFRASDAFDMAKMSADALVLSMGDLTGNILAFKKVAEETGDMGILGPDLEEAASKLGLTTTQMAILTKSVAEIGKASTLDELVTSGNNFRTLLGMIYENASDIPPEMRELARNVITANITAADLARSFGDVKDNAEGAAGAARELALSQWIDEPSVDVAKAKIEELRKKWAEYKASLNKPIKIPKPKKEPLIELSDEMKRLMKLSEDIGSKFETAFMDVVRGTASVKDAFRTMAADIIAELYRVFVVKKITGFITDAVGLFMGPAPGSSGSLTTRSVGGPVSAGQPYLVGERGPELMIPSSNGKIIPNNQLGGGASVIVNQTINVSTGVQQTVRTEIKSLMPQIAESAKAAVADAKRRGGSYGRAFA